MTMSPALRPRRRLPQRLPQAALQPTLVSPVIPLRAAAVVAPYLVLPVNPPTLRHLAPITIGPCRTHSMPQRPLFISGRVSNTGNPRVVSISCSFTLTQGSRSAFVSATPYSWSKVSKLYRWYTNKSTTKGDEEDKPRQARFIKRGERKKTFNLFKMFYLCK